MKLLRENIVPAAFLALWVGVSGYTLHKLSGMRGARVVEATVDLTVTAPARSTANVSCPEARSSLTLQM
jgi:hypothetical protein